MSVLLVNGPVEDMGVYEGDDAVEGPVKPSKGSSACVWTACVEQSIFVAVIWQCFSLPNDSVEVRHSSSMGLGVTEPPSSSAGEELPVVVEVVDVVTSFPPNIDVAVAEAVFVHLEVGVPGMAEVYLSSTRQRVYLFRSAT